MFLNADEINSVDVSKLKLFISDKKLSFAMAQKDKIDYIYNTSALEGNDMSYPEVETLLDGITVGGKKLSDEQQILNQNRAVNLLFDMIKNNSFEISKDVFLKLHNEVAREEALTWGVFRNSGVNIGGTDFKPPLHSELDSIFSKGMEELAQVSHPILKSISFFAFGAKNQFFHDGNKRTSRLMMNGILLDNGLPILNMKVKDKLEINKQMLDFYDHNNIQKFIAFFCDYYYTQNRYLIEHKVLDAQVTLNNPKLQQELEIVGKDHTAIVDKDGWKIVKDIDLPKTSEKKIEVTKTPKQQSKGMER